MNAIDVIGSKIALSGLLAAAEPGGTIGVARLSAIAGAPAVEELGDYWLRTLIETAERGGVGRLERAQGDALFRFASDLPGLDAAIGRALDAVG